MAASTDSRHAQIELAVEALRAQRTICYPTETVYGLGAAIDSPTALHELSLLKGRDADKPFSILVHSMSAARQLMAGPVPAAAARLAEAFWPGPLTIVARASEALDSRMVGEGGGVGLRCSSDPIAAELLTLFGKPITSTSANPGGDVPAGSVVQARGYFGNRIAAYVDGGSCSGRSASTVVVVGQGRVKVMRVGAIGKEELAAVVDIDA